MSDWQPIETAPKDGTWIIVARQHQHKFPAFARWVVNRVHGSGWWMIHDHKNFWPTHWMPLPPAPTPRRPRE